MLEALDEWVMTCFISSSANFYLFYDTVTPRKVNLSFTRATTNFYRTER